MNIIERIFSVLSKTALILPIFLLTITISTPGFSQIIVTNGGDGPPSLATGCTLREAIMNANDNAATNPDCEPGIGPNDIIQIDSKVEFIGLEDPIEITDSLIIQGNSGMTDIGGGMESRIFRVPVPVTLDLRLLRLQNALSVQPGQVPLACTLDSGEGAAVCSVGTVLLSQVEISENRTGGDGAVGGGIAANRVEFVEVSILNNQTFGSSARGGGVFIGDGEASQIGFSRIEGNRTNDDFSNGGGLYATSEINIVNSIFRFNETLGASSEGGALFASSALNMQSSTVANNQITGEQSQGGALHLSDDAVIINSTLAENIADNMVNPQAGAIYSLGNLSVFNSTISNNTANSGAGGIRSSSNIQQIITIDSTILADNHGMEGNFSSDGSPLDASYSLFGDPENGINGLNIANQFSNSPGLEALSDNGCGRLAGSPIQPVCVPTMLLQPGSLALDNGSNDVPVNTDQRGLGFPRTLGPQTDIGAIEMPGAIVIDAVPVPTLHWASIFLLILMMMLMSLWVLITQARDLDNDD